MATRTNLTDRAKRYRAQNNVSGPRKCVICGKGGKLDVMHLDGFEDHGEKANLAYGCRSCNGKLAAAFKRIGAGMPTNQYNPSTGVPSFQQYAWAVANHSRGSHDEGGAIIHATPRHKRIEYAKRIAGTKRERGTDSSVPEWARGNPGTVDYTVWNVRTERPLASGGKRRFFLGAHDGLKHAIDAAEREAKRTGDQYLVAGSDGAHYHRTNPAKLDRCVKAVEKKGGAQNAYAMCSAALKKNPGSDYEVTLQDLWGKTYTVETFSESSKAAKEAALRHMPSGYKVVRVVGKKRKQNPRAAITLKGVEYDKEQNRTWIEVETPEFTKRYYVSGYVSKPKALGFVRARVERELKEFRSNPSDAYQAGSADLRSAAARLGTVNLSPSMQQREDWKHAWKEYMAGWNAEKRRKNPADASAQAFEEFHGYPSSELVTVTSKVHRHKHLASAGDLVGLQVEPVAGGKSRRIEGLGDALLTFNEKKNQLFITGGDQFLPEAELENFVGADFDHELLTLGKLTAVGYFTKKTHLGKDGGVAVYDHTFRTTNENGRHVVITIARYPDLIYRVLDQQFEISGGSYTIRAEGIDK